MIEIISIIIIDGINPFTLGSGRATITLVQHVDKQIQFFAIVLKPG